MSTSQIAPDLDDASGLREVAIIPTSHLDLFWLGDYRNCLRRGDEVIRAYLDRCSETDETFVIDTAIFAEHFLVNNPEYESTIRELIAEGRLEIGAAYIDRWENLVLGESLIRNVQIGRIWARDALGYESRLAAHPDLPGLNAQTSQIYAQAGIHYYVTSRKIFHEGRIWRHVSPDGTRLLMLTWPLHYVFVPMRTQDLEPSTHRNFTHGFALPVDDLESRYPLGVLPMSGSAGDLTTPTDFIARYGAGLEHYLDKYRDQYPHTVWRYATPSDVLKPYLAAPDVSTTERSGTIPSVWGVAADEEMRFFHRAREVEHELLSAETAAVLAISRARSVLPESATKWSGLYGETAFFGSTDFAPEGREFEWLWRMQVFTQDHNGGGQDGALSTFQKKVRQDRVSKYSNEVIAHALSGQQSEDSGIGVLHVRLGWSEEFMVVDEPVASLIHGLDRADSSTQRVSGPDGAERLALAMEPRQGVGVNPLTLAQRDDERLAVVEVTGEVISVRSELLSLRVDRRTGAWSVNDIKRKHDWTGMGDYLDAMPELGNDTSPVFDGTGRVQSTAVSAEVIGRGPLCTQIRIRRHLLGVEWTTVLTVWNDTPRIDNDIFVEWPGREDWQIVMPLVTAERDVTYYGTAFHSSRWDDIPEGASAGEFFDDELRPDDYAAYREVQHWLHVVNGGAGLTITTGHPAFRHDGQTLESVLLRTPASCGDPRLHWNNSGENSWHFEFYLADADLEAAAERGDTSWRQPVVQAGATQESVDLLRNVGDPVQLSALFPSEGGSTSARLINQSDRPVDVKLTGGILRSTVRLADLDGTTTEEVSVVDGSVSFHVRPWKIQTVVFAEAGRR